MSEYGFYAMMSRMKYINRWALMRNNKEENLSEHCLEVSIIAHALATISNVRFGGHLNAEKAALIGLYHDASEIITGDMPTPVKYYNDDIKSAFKEVENVACHKLLHLLPDDLREAYEPILLKNDEDDYLWKLVKCADKISAMIKCIEEIASGNSEFKSAYESTSKTLDDMADKYPEVRVFIDEFLSAYGQTLDELQRK